MLLKISLTLLFFSEKPNHAIVNDTVEASKVLKKEKLVNAVLRNILRNKDKIKYENLIYPNFKKILNKIFTSTSIRNYIYKSLFIKPINYQISLLDKKDALYSKRVFMLKERISKGCFVQDIGNFEVIKSTSSFFIDKKLIDLCAAPGGKSILLHSLGFNVTAIDKSQKQLSKFKMNLKRLNINLEVQKIDFLKRKINVKYNSILLDAPCSALGTFRRNPDVTLKIDQSKIKKHQKIQLEMLEKSLEILNNKGFLVYVVCSFHPFETIDVIDKIMRKHKNIKMHKIESNKMIKKQCGYFINPQTLGGSFSNIEKIILDLNDSKAEYIHFDVMDGDFVPNLTFGPKFISDVKSFSNKVFDVHLMINRVEKYIDNYIEAGSDIISFHLEIEENIKKIINKIKSKGKKCGLAVKPKTSWSEIRPYLSLIDQVIIMTVEPGFGGQSFMNNQVDKIRNISNYIKSNNLNTDIEIDGGINFETGKTCIQAGANILVAGSFLFNQSDIISATNSFSDKFN